MWEGMREAMVCKYNESESNKRRWAGAAAAVLLQCRCQVPLPAFGCVALGCHLLAPGGQGPRAPHLCLQRSASLPACLPACLPFHCHQCAATGGCCRREEELRSGPNYVSLEPPPPGCDRGESRGSHIVGPWDPPALLPGCLDVFAWLRRRAASARCLVPQFCPADLPLMYRMCTACVPPARLPADALKLYVGGMPTTATVEDIQATFKGFGRVRPCLPASSACCQLEAP